MYYFFTSLPSQFLPIRNLIGPLSVLLATFENTLTFLRTIDSDVLQDDSSEGYQELMTDVRQVVSNEDTQFWFMVLNKTVIKY